MNVLLHCPAFWAWRDVGLQLEALVTWGQLPPLHVPKQDRWPQHFHDHDQKHSFDLVLKSFHRSCPHNSLGFFSIKEWFWKVFIEKFLGKLYPLSIFHEVTHFIYMSNKKVGFCQNSAKMNLDLNSKALFFMNVLCLSKTLNEWHDEL